MVVINDPGIENGQGMMVPLGTFVGAWEDSGYHMVNTTGNHVVAGSNEQELPAIGQYRNVGWAYSMEASSSDLIMSNDGYGYSTYSDYIAGTNPYEPK